MARRWDSSQAGYNLSARNPYHDHRLGQVMTVIRDMVPDDSHSLSHIAETRSPSSNFESE